MLEASRLSQVLKEMIHYKLDLLGLSETRWNGSGEITTASGELLLYSGRAMGEKHEYVVGLILSKNLKKSLIEWRAVSERILIARLNTRLRKLTVVQCYAPTNEATMEEKEAFYGLLETTLHQIRQSDIKIMMGDFNAKIGDDNLGVKHVMGRYGLGNRNENGERLIDLCVHYEMIIGGSLFPHKDIHKATWMAPNHRTSNQIDHIAISKKWRSLLDVRSYKGADVASDHYLVVAQIKLKLAANRSPNQRVIRKKFNIEKLNQRETRKKFEEELKNSLEQVYMEESGPTEQWSKIKETMLTKGENILGLKQRKEAKDWITEETWEEINKRKITKQKINNADDETKPTLLAQYADTNKHVKRFARRDKRAWADKLAHKTQLAAEENNLKELYQITKQLAGKPITPQQVGVRDLTGRLLTIPQNQLTRWQEYFKDNFAMPPQQTSMSNTQMTPEPTKIPIGAPTINEIKMAIKHLKQNKASRPDNLPAEFFRTYPNTIAHILEPLLKKV
jgi:hypothetical protein